MHLILKPCRKQGKSSARSRTSLPAPELAALPLGDPSDVEKEAADQAGAELLARDETADADADELEDALKAFADAPDEEEVRE